MKRCCFGGPTETPDSNGIVRARVRWLGLFSYIFATKPSHRTRARTIPFESGVSTGPPPQQRFTISFYLTAMLFIVFDIEIVFLYPLAVTLNALGWFAFFELLFFVAILALAYVYIWRKGALEWR